MADSRQLLAVQEVLLTAVRDIAGQGYLYVLADGACSLEVPRKVVEVGETLAVSLYRGYAEEEFWEVAPYLIRLDPQLLDWVLRLPENFGVLLVSKADLDTLRRHLRRFLMVQPPGGRPWLFRYYDPRALRAFLPACVVHELQTFFGPVVAIGLTAPGVDKVTFIRPVVPQDPSAASQAAANPAVLFPLRPEHVEALRRPADEALAREIMEFIEQLRPAVVANLPKDVFMKRVLVGIDRARRYKFLRKSSVVSFVTMMFDIAPNFDEQPAIRAVLTDPRYTPDLRMDMLIGRTRAEDWNEAESRADAKVWAAAAEKGRN
jgi:uncharacterized protein DUF4123